MIKASMAGDAAVLIDTDVPAAWLAAAISSAELPGVRDVVPGARTVLVISEPASALPPAELAARVSELPVPPLGGDEQADIEVPVVYDGQDLADVAALTGLSVAEVIGRHAGARYTVGWIGFSPGFGYLTGLDERLSTVPRLATPRLNVPAGTVAIAAGLAAVYPSASPGGWRILGRTELRLWDTAREPAALLTPGRTVRFLAVRAEDGPGKAAMTPRRRPASAGQPVARQPVAHQPVARIEVVRTGPLATVQDLGRPGLAAMGVPPSGAADARSLISGNRLVGNQEGAAGIELTLGRAAFRFAHPARIAVSGAPCAVRVGLGPGGAARQFGAGVGIEVPAGSDVSVGAPQAGLRSYLTVAGGVASQVVLGSRSADLLSGIGGGPLRPGDVLPIGDGGPAAPPRPAGGPATPIQGRGGVAALRVIGGPRLDWFSAGALDLLCGGVYTVTPASNRTGLRLDGPRLRHGGGRELPSEGLVTGALQVPRDGSPILLLADHPATGGYPVIAVVVSADIGAAAQLRPGDLVRFTALY
jgi:KipI family sensor histidine kinase inhibitor